MGSMVYMVICIFETRYQLKKVRTGYQELKNNYKDVLSDLEIKEAFQEDKLLRRQISRLKRINWMVYSLGCYITVMYSCY